MPSLTLDRVDVYKAESLPLVGSGHWPYLANVGYQYQIEIDLYTIWGLPLGWGQDEGDVLFHLLLKPVHLGHGDEPEKDLNVLNKACIMIFTLVYQSPLVGLLMGGGFCL